MYTFWWDEVEVFPVDQERTFRAESTLWIDTRNKSKELTRQYCRIGILSDEELASLHLLQLAWTALPSHGLLPKSYEGYRAVKQNAEDATDINENTTHSLTYSVILGQLSFWAYLSALQQSSIPDVRALSIKGLVVWGLDHSELGAFRAHVQVLGAHPVKIDFIKEQQCNDSQLDTWKQ